MKASQFHFKLQHFEVHHIHISALI